MNVHAPVDSVDDESLLVALANTGHLEADELDDPDAVARWWRGLPGTAEWTGDLGTPEDVRLLHAARKAIRHLTLRNNGVEAPIDEEIATLGRLPLRFGFDGRPDLVLGGETTLARYIASRAIVGLLRGPAVPQWHRLKACPGPDCAWVFRDRSRNGSRRWCDMAACGNRAKAASFRTRGRRAQ